MIPFEAATPFPLVSESHRESEHRAHAAACDAWLGLRTGTVEAELARHGSRRLVVTGSSRKSDRQELWFGLDVQALLTPYTELRALLARLAPRSGETVVDLGAAYGRMGFVLHRHHPGVRFVGYECVGERVEEGRRAFARFGCDMGARLEHADIADDSFAPAAAEYYFLYDFGTDKAIEKALFDLRRLSESRAITVIGRGRRCRYLIETRHAFWLSSVSAVGSLSGELRYSIYRSGPSTRPLLASSNA